MHLVRHAPEVTIQKTKQTKHKQTNKQIKPLWHILQKPTANTSLTRTANQKEEQHMFNSPKLGRPSPGTTLYKGAGRDPTPVC